MGPLPQCDEGDNQGTKNRVAAQPVQKCRDEEKEEKMIDRTTKTILAAIALGLFANAVTPMLRPTPVAAQDPLNCTGELLPNSKSDEVVTGWALSVKCR